MSFTYDGKPDSMAWYNTDVPGWIATLGGAGGLAEHDLAPVDVGEDDGVTGEHS